MDCKHFFSKFWNRLRSRMTAVHRALTRDFNYSTDFFFGVDFLMAVGGARLDSQNRTFRRCWNVHRALMVLLVSMIFWNTWLTVLRLDSLDIVLSSLQASFGLGSVTLRMWLLVWYYEPLVEVRRYLNRRLVGRNLQPTLGVRSEAFYHIRKVVTWLTVGTFFWAASVLFVDLSSHHYLKLPFDMSELFPSNHLIFQKIVHLWIVGTAMRAVMVFIIIYEILIGLIAEVTVIAHTFAATFENTNQRVQLELESQPGNSQKLEKMKQYYFWKFVQEEFNECIQNHVEFFALLDKIKPLLNATFLTIYYATAINMSSGAIYLSQLKTINLFALQTLLFCVFIAFECALLTRLVSVLTDENESIGWQVYNLDWPTELTFEQKYQTEYRSIRKAMLTVMAVSGQSLGLDCFGFLEFTQDQFWELLNMVYSLYTFFRDFV